MFSLFLVSEALNFLSYFNIKQYFFVNITNLLWSMKVFTKIKFQSKAGIYKISKRYIAPHTEII